jgi:anaerobic selenocysteine-containing dehydrogenase
MGAEVVNDRVVRLDADPGEPGSFLCAKVRRFPALASGGERVLRPLRRVRAGTDRGAFEPISWDAALDLVVARLVAERATPSAVLPYWYGGSNGLLTGNAVDAWFFHRIGASDVLRTLCAANTGAGARAAWGDLPSADPADVDNMDGLLLWGCNPSSSGIHYVPRVRALKARGGFLAVVDPRRTPLAAIADLHLPIQPGTDVAVAHALAHVALRDGLADIEGLRSHAVGVEAWEAEVARWTPERAATLAGVDAGALVGLAHGYAAQQRAMVRCGWGLERNRNGVDAVRAVLTLPAVFGKMASGGWALSTSAGYGMALDRIRPPPSGRRTFNMTGLATVLETAADPPVRVLFVYNCNPVATVPDQDGIVRQLRRPDLFTVVHDAFFTDTAAEADLVLPSTTFLEHADLSRSYSAYVLRWAPAVVPPPGEAWSNHRLFCALAQRMGFGDEAPFDRNEDAWAQAICGTVPGATDELWPALREARSAAVPPSRQTWPWPVRLADPEPPRHRPNPCDGDLPLALLSPASPRGINSLLMHDVRAVLRLSSADAASRGLQAGEPVAVENARGRVVVDWEVGADLPQGVCELPKGLWRRATRNARTATALTPDHVDARGGGACYNDARVEVSRAGPA